MIKDGVRKFIVSALEQSNVVGIRRHQSRGAFLDGQADIEFTELGMDSLARMELCIYVEVNAGIEITPDRLDEFKSLNGLAQVLSSVGIVEIFRRQIARCRTVNQVNRLHIAFENRMTPLELAELLRAVSVSDPSSASLAWARELQDQLRLSGKEVPERFARTRIKPNAFLYSDLLPSAQKTLVICFSGGAGRLAMPVPTFLQHLPASQIDVLLLSRHHASQYSNGIVGLASSFDGLMGVLGGIIGVWNYRHIVTYGTSVGGLPALLAALHLNLDKGISVAGLPLDRDGWRALKADRNLQDAIDRWNGRPKLLYVFGAGNDKDRAAGIDLKKDLPMELLPFPNETSHSATTNCLLAGELSGFLSSVLLPAGKRKGRFQWLKDLF